MRLNMQGGLHLVTFATFAACVGMLGPRVCRVERPLVHPDAIVVLASHESERLPAAARRAAVEPHARLVLTVPTDVGPSNCDDCGRRPARLNALGVDGTRILELSLRGRVGTWAEATTVVERARSEGWTRILVVTSAFHTRRAFMAFQRAAHGRGIQIGVHAAATPTRWWRSLDGWRYAGYETAALAEYARRGYLAW